MYWLKVVTTENINAKISFWDWVNDNNGTVMCILTLVYVIATVLIWYSNKRSADAAVAANKQNYALTLLDKRLKSYYCLNEWVSIAKTLFIINFMTGNPTDAFNSMLYNNQKNEELDTVNNQLNSIEDELENDGLSDEERAKLVALQKKLLQQRFIKRMVILDKEHGLIRQIEILFSDIDYKTIEEFADAFSEAALNSSDINKINTLKEKIQALNNKKILEDLWKKMKDESR